MAAVQLGKYLGAKVIATGTSEEKLALTKEWGADHTVLTHKNGDVEFRQEVKDLTEGKVPMSFTILLVETCLITP